MVVANRDPKAAIVVSADATGWEAKAAADLRKYVKEMTGAELPVIHDPLKSGAKIFVGRAALRAEPQMATRLAGVAKENPLVQADAIVVRRQGFNLYIAGSNDESHYFAVAWLLQQWGCRWYLPTAFGEVVPDHADLTVGKLDFAYAPPFEIRRYWLSWNGDTSGADEFRHHNFMSDANVRMDQVLDRYTSDIAPPGGTHFQVPFSAPATAEHVAGKVEADYAAGKDISLAIADGLYGADADVPLISDYDRYMLAPSLTDAMLTLYNNVADLLRRKYPQSKAKIGGLAYTNATLPPRKVTQLAPNIVMWIAPIDIDPNHAMDDPRSPSRQEYRRMLEQWAKVTQGRLAIYDYDQSMLVWRDLPNPSQQVFARDVKEYRRLGLLGLGTESRGALATVFLNLFFRGQLMWNPDADVGRMLTEFYPAFYGPAAEPMARYWNAIFQAWNTTAVTEHEYMAAPAIYTPALVQSLKRDLEDAEAVMQRQRGGIERNEDLYRQRLQFTRLSFEIIANYVAMTSAAARDADYPVAAKAGDAALAARLKLAQMNPTFTTHVVGTGAETVQSGPAWFPGEVDHMRALAALTDGTRGTLVTRLPLLWSFALEQPVPNDWIYLGPEGTEAGRNRAPPDAGWQPVRTDLYLQGQGVGAGPVGHYWYKTTVDLDQAQTGRPVHIRFPGLFNEVWLYVNGQLVAHRDYREPWWRADYRFEWDADLTGRLKPGANVIALRGFNPHHFGGIFRRPFLYIPG